MTQHQFFHPLNTPLPDDALVKEDRAVRLLLAVERLDREPASKKQQTNLAALARLVLTEAGVITP